jgi:hypothetical protein
VVQEILTVIKNKRVALLDARSAVETIASPVALNSSGKRDTKSVERSTPKTPKAVTIKKASGITDIKK